MSFFGINLLLILVSVAPSFQHTETTPNEFPFFVVIFKDLLPHGYICGGAIIDREWVLTSALCVEDANFMINAGDHNLGTHEGTEQTLKPGRIIVHPNYDENTYDDNIALIKVSPPFDLSWGVGTVSMVTTEFSANEGTSALETGWGYVGQDFVLKKSHVEVMEAVPCSAKYGVELPPSGVVCGVERVTDGCSKKYGGALLCPGQNSTTALCGFDSFTFCSTREPNVFIDIGFYREWITSEMEKDGIGL